MDCMLHLKIYVVDVIGLLFQAPAQTPLYHDFEIAWQRTGNWTKSIFLVSHCKDSRCVQ